jgi:hypothetical protein
MMKSLGMMVTAPLILLPNCPGCHFNFLLILGRIKISPDDEDEGVDI